MPLFAVKPTGGHTGNGDGIGVAVFLTFFLTGFLVVAFLLGTVLEVVVGEAEVATVGLIGVVLGFGVGVAAKAVDVISEVARVAAINNLDLTLYSI
jgi:hypothetical protein